MPYQPIQLPLRGYTEQNAFSRVPEGFTPSALNVLPHCPFTGRQRIAVRPGVNARYDFGGETPPIIQHIGTYSIYVSGVLEEMLLIVAGGLVYTLRTTELTPVLASGQGSPLLSTTGIVEGVQFRDYYYLVDGTNYVRVQLPLTTPAASVWTAPASIAASGQTARLIARFGARLVLGGVRTIPNNWWMSKIDDPNDWTPTALQPEDAITGDTSGRYGQLGEPLTAIVPFGERGLLFGTTASMTYLTSDPAFGDARMVEMSRTVGIVGPRAWCHGPEKTTFVLGSDGLYLLNPNTFAVDRASRLTAGRLDTAFLRLDFGSAFAAFAAGGGTTASAAGGTSSSTTTEDAVTTTFGVGVGGNPAEVLGEGGLAFAEDPTQFGEGYDPTQGPPDPDPQQPPPQTTDPNAPLVDAALVFDVERQACWVWLLTRASPSSSLHYVYHLPTDSIWPIRLYDPMQPGPVSVTAIPATRQRRGRILLGSQFGRISEVARDVVTSIDGWVVGAMDQIPTEFQQAARIRAHVALGPIEAPAPADVFLRDVRVQLGDDRYVPPPELDATQEPPRIVASLGDTAQSAIGLAAETVNFFQLPSQEAIVDQGNAASVPSSFVDSGGASASSVDRLDERIAQRPFGTYTSANQFLALTERVYTGPTPWQLLYDAVQSRWEITHPTTGQEYVQQTSGGVPVLPSDPSSYRSVFEVTGGVANGDYASVSGSSMPSGLLRDVGILGVGRNSGRRCRIRAGAIYLSLTSTGFPFSIENVSALVDVVGPDRGTNRE
jgi:hypothetical protein